MHGPSKFSRFRGDCVKGVRGSDVVEEAAGACPPPGPNQRQEGAVWGQVKGHAEVGDEKDSGQGDWWK